MCDWGDNASRTARASTVTASRSQRASGTVHIIQATHTCDDEQHAPNNSEHTRATGTRPGAKGYAKDIAKCK